MEQERILKNLDYFQSGSRSRLRTVRTRLDKEIERSIADVNRFYTRDLDEIYRVGLVGGGLDGDYKLRITDQPAMADLRNQGLRRSRNMGKKAKDRNRMVMKYRRMDRDAAEKLGTHFLEPKMGGNSWNNMTYQTLIIRTDAQKAYNLGVIEGASRKKVKAFLCVDGPGCGLTSHDDPFKVDGELFSAIDARTYVISHPNCVRRWEPVPGEDKPPPIGRRKAEFLGTSQARERLTELADFVDRNVEIDYMALAIDLATDAQMREMVFDTILKAKDSWTGFRTRIDNLAAKYLGTRPTDEEIFDRMIYYLDEMASGAQAPEWVYEILDARTTEGLKAAGDDFHTFVRVNYAKNATHAELNMVNRMEEHYGHFFQARLSAAHPNAADKLFDMYRGVRQHYSEPRIRIGGKTISIPRLGGEAFRGPRFSWGSRPIKIQTTIVNKNRHMTREELRAAMMKIGLVPKITDDSGLAGDFVRGMFRHEMIEALGYNPGLLSHVTLNPQGAFRIGLRLSPTGWIQPEIRLVPKLVPLRYTLRLNRGMPIDGVRIKSVTQEFRAVLGNNFGTALPQGGRLSLPSIGISTNTVLGRIEHFDDIKRIVANYTREGFDLNSQPVEALRQQARFILKGQAMASINALDKGQLIDILDGWGAGLSGRELLLRNTEVLSMFAELRLSGYNHFHISKILRITPDEALEMLGGVKMQMGELWRERSMKLFMQVAAQQAAAAIDAGMKYAFVSPMESAKNAYRHTAHIMDDFTGWLGTTGKNTFAGKVYNDGIEGYQFIKDFKKGTFGADLIYRYGPKFREIKYNVETAWDILTDPNLHVNWRKIAQTAIMSPPQIIRYMRDVSVSVGRTIGYEAQRGSNYIFRIMSSQGPIANFFRHAPHQGDNVYALGNIMFTADGVGSKGKGFFLGPNATVPELLRFRQIREEILQITSKHQQDVIDGLIRLRDSAKNVLKTVTKEIRQRLIQFNEWLDLSLDEMEQVLLQIAKLLETSGADKITERQLREFITSLERGSYPENVTGEKIRGYSKRATKGLEDKNQEIRDLNLPPVPLFVREDFSKEYWDQFGDMMEEMNRLHSARRGSRAAEGKMRFFMGQAPREGFMGYFHPVNFNYRNHRFDHGEMVSFTSYPGGVYGKADLLNTLSHEMGHAQDFDYLNNFYVSDIGSNVTAALHSSRRVGTGLDNPVFRSFRKGGALVDFDTLANELVDEDLVVLMYGFVPTRVTREVLAQAKFYNAWLYSEQANFMRKTYINLDWNNPDSYGYIDFLDYLMQPVEIWARSYSQRVAARHGMNSIYYKNVAQYSGDRYMRQQYDVREYRRMEKYVDEVLRARGVLN